MLFSKLALAASCAVAASLAAPLEKLSQGESVIPRSPSAEQKLDAMRRWNEKVLAASENVASKYVSASGRKCKTASPHTSH